MPERWRAAGALVAAGAGVADRVAADERRAGLGAVSVPPISSNTKDGQWLPQARRPADEYAGRECQHGFCGNGYVVNKTKADPYQGLDVTGRIVVVGGTAGRAGCATGSGGSGSRWKRRRGGGGGGGDAARLLTIHSHGLHGFFDAGTGCGKERRPGGNHHRELSAA